MKATVSSVQYVPSIPEATGGLVIEFDQVVFDNYRDDYNRDVNALGLRLRRILLMHAPNAIIVAAPKRYEGFAFLVERTKKVKGFEDKAAAQRTVNKYLNAKIIVTFEEHGVFYRTGSKYIPCKDLNQVKQAWAQGKTVDILIEFKLNLPTQKVDYKALKVVLPKGAMVGGANGLYNASVVFEVCDASVAADPFLLLKELKNKILKVRFE